MRINTVPVGGSGGGKYNLKGLVLFAGENNKEVTILEQPSSSYVLLLQPYGNVIAWASDITVTSFKIQVSSNFDGYVGWEVEKENAMRGKVDFADENHKQVSFAALPDTNYIVKLQPEDNIVGWVNPIDMLVDSFIIQLSSNFTGKVGWVLERL